ncbi:MAG: PIN domain-containing protein [Eubacteriales bacterium]|nr:PIN domain-containing protein [Eubacteriales bacterium]
MMVLIDTNIIIDIWKNQDSPYKTVFEHETVCICGVVRSELLHGAYSEKNLELISNKLDNLETVSIQNDDWDEFGRMLYKLRINGVTLPYADALIAYIAMKNKVCILTKDKHFKLIEEVFPDLMLYS